MGENVQLIWAVVAAVALVNSVLIGYCVSRLRAMTQLQKMDRELEKAHSALRSDVKALFDSAKGLGSKLNQIERQMRSMEERQDQLSLKEPSEQAYSHSVRLIKSGVPVEQVIEQSGLSRGEVELLLLLNRIEIGSGAANSSAPPKSNFL